MNDKKKKVTGAVNKLKIYEENSFNLMAVIFLSLHSGIWT